MFPTLFNVEDQSFQVFAFGMVDVDGMVGWLVQLMEDADFSLCHCCGSEDCHSELVLVDGLRAAEGEEDTAGLYLFESFGVEFRVAP